MKLAKDLFYNRNNKHLDISRLSSGLIVVLFIGLCIFAYGFRDKPFDPLEFGAGWTAVAGGCAAWIYARQKQEVSDA